MKLAINPHYMIAGISGLGLVSFSELANPGYGQLGFWIVIIGFSAFTVFMTLQHAKGEAHRTRRGAHWGITTVRVVILSIISLAIFREISVNMAILTINQLLLFGVIFDPARNHHTGKSFYYHGGESLYDRLVSKHAEVFFILEIAAYIATSIYLIVSV